LRWCWHLSLEAFGGILKLLNYIYILGLVELTFKVAIGIKRYVRHFYIFKFLI